ncbi:tetratricopeptide repeat protein [Paucihalobacter sp.]|uniref:tetratricopeptide repeat protein n=1 Tax=Paucihalobacter sp. TaxID=2850405 RepID=UPI002FE2A77A
MKNLILDKYRLILWMVALPWLICAQELDEKALLQKQNKAQLFVAEGNESFQNEDFITAEMAYRKAMSQQSNTVAASYNLGNGFYKEGNFDEALYRHEQAAKDATSKTEKHKAFHNIGNILMQNQLCKEAVEAFKNALRNNPNDDETRYNLAMAKECAKHEKEQDEKDDEDSDDKKDEKDEKNQEQQDQDKKDEQGDDNEDKKDQGDEDKQDGNDKEDEEGKPDEDKDENDKGDDSDKQQQQPQPRPSTLNGQQIKNLLEALNDKESKVQEKINAEKQKGAKVKNEKDW